jgi:hypothetical protein
MALLENRTGASVNPGNRQDNAQIVVFVATKLTMVARPAAFYWRSWNRQLSACDECHRAFLERGGGGRYSNNDASHELPSQKPHTVAPA